MIPRFQNIVGDAQRAMDFLEILGKPRIGPIQAIEYANHLLEKIEMDSRILTNWKPPFRVGELDFRDVKKGGVIGKLDKKSIASMIVLDDPLWDGRHWVTHVRVGDHERIMYFKNAKLYRHEISPPNSTASVL